MKKAVKKHKIQKRMKEMEKYEQLEISLDDAVDLATALPQDNLISVTILQKLSKNREWLSSLIEGYANLIRKLMEASQNGVDGIRMENGRVIYVKDSLAKMLLGLETLTELRDGTLRV